MENPNPFRKNRIFVYFCVGIVAALTSIALYGGVSYLYQVASTKAVPAVLDNPASADSKSTVTNGDAGLSQLKKTSESFRSIAKKVGPVVVNIRSTRGSKKPKIKIQQRKHQQRPQAPNEEEENGMPRDPFLDFFERFGQPFPFQQMPEQPQTAFGSGIIIDKSGIVVTNNHVIDGATEIKVQLPNSRTDIKAKVIGTDPKTDLAVLRIEGQKNLTAAEWADSDSVEVGDWAIAIGSPFQLDQSVTVGIVSAKGRSAAELGNAYAELIQTDAAINPGNSGGPLVDLEGRVMGVNTAIYTRSGGYMGIGFAIPSNTAKDVVEKLIKHGKITRGWLGVMIQPLDEELAKELNVKEGVEIHEVLEKSPAEDAGVKAGDVIVEVNGKQVKDTAQLQRIIGNFKPNEKVKLKLVSYTDKKERTVTVKIGTLPDQEPEPKGETPTDEPDAVGLIVSERKGQEGVVVEAVAPGSPADQFGIEPGDIVVKINRKPVTSAATYKKLVSSTKRLYLEIKRKNRTLFFRFSLPE